MQVGYSFLIGGMCALAMTITRNLFFPAILHAIFDVGGLMTDSRIGIATGNQWDKVTIIITAVLGVAVLIYMVVLCFKQNYKEIEEIYYQSN